MPDPGAGVYHLGYTQDMKYIGIDYGSKRVGVAVSDAEGTIAFPRSVLKNDNRLMGHLRLVAEEEKPDLIIVGDTLSHSSGRNTVSADADAFVETLAAETGVTVKRGFEVWSSIEASRYAPEESPHHDAAAAAIILQRYIDMNAGMNTDNTNMNTRTDRLR